MGVFHRPPRYRKGEDIVNNKFLSIIPALFLAALVLSTVSAYAQAITIKDGGTLRLEIPAGDITSGTRTEDETLLKLNCEKIVVESNGTLDLINGTIEDCGGITRESGSIYNRVICIIRYCSGFNPAIYLLLLLSD
jgi:hypothetical protein